MLGLRQSLVTTGKVGGGLIKTDIGEIGGYQDGGAILLLSADLSSNQSIAYTVLNPTHLTQITVGGIRSYAATWEQCRDFAHEQSFVFKKETDENVKIVGACEYTGQTGTSDPRFKIYPKLYLNTETELSQFPLVGNTEEILTTQAPLVINLYPNNPNTYLLREWWELEYLQNPEKYPTIKFIWGPRLSETSTHAYIFSVEDGYEYITSVNERHSFLLFRSYTYNTFIQTEQIPESSNNASVPTVSRGKAQFSPTASPLFNNAIYGFNNVTVNPYELGKFPIELEVICDYNAQGIYNIPPPFDKFKTVTSLQGFKNFDSTQAPGVTITANLIYADRTLVNGSPDDPTSWYVYQNQTLEFVFDYWGTQTTAFKQEVIQPFQQNSPGKIRYTFRFLLDMRDKPGFETGRDASIVGPISIYDFRFKFPNYKESNPISYTKYIAGYRNLFIINKNIETFNVAAQNNNLLLNRLVQILQGAAI